MLKSKFNLGSLSQAMNTKAVPLYRYGAGIGHWTKQESKQADRKARKLIALHIGMHPRLDADRIYVERKKEGRGLMINEEAVK